MKNKNQELAFTFLNGLFTPFRCNRLSFIVFWVLEEEKKLHKQNNLNLVILSGSILSLSNTHIDTQYYLSIFTHTHTHTHIILSHFLFFSFAYAFLLSNLPSLFFSARLFYICSHFLYFSMYSALIYAFYLPPFFLFISITFLILAFLLDAKFEATKKPRLCL